MIVKRKVKVEDLRRFKFVSDPQITPDGEIIAFVLSTINYEKNTYERHIWLADTATGKTRQFTHGPGSDMYPRWSPDGKQLLFLSKGRDAEQEKTQIWVISRSGGEARLVAETEEGISKPVWSYNSREILFLSKVWTEDKPESDVKVVRRIKYKLNGEETFEGRRTHLFSTRVGGKPRQLTDGEFDVEVAIWSPNGESIAFIANMDEDADISRVKDLFLLPSNGGEPLKLTDSRHVINDISWSPDGRWLAFIGHDQPEGLAINFDLWIMPVEGEEIRNLTADFDRSLYMGVGSDLRVPTPNPGAVWSQEGDSIYFLTASTPNANLYKVNIDDGAVEEIIGGRTIDGFSVSRKGRVIAFNALDATHPAVLWVMDDDGERRLTNFNNRLLKGLDLSTPERFTFKNSLGEDVDGWVLKPTNFREGGLCPTILEIHGGPRAVYGDAIFHEFQLLAAEGYAVIYTNPRGSAGYGEDYAKAVMGHYSECDYEDLMAFTDEAIKRFSFIDESRLGVTGGSYGGYMTNWIISHTNKFKAAVTFRSICNWVSKFGCSDIGYMQPESIAGDPDYWENMDKHLARSPIRHAKNVKTPTLIVHSEDDLRCPMEQAEQWFVALKLQGIPTELVRFPGENHDLSRSGKPKHREERLRHMIRWFDKYLKQSVK